MKDSECKAYHHTYKCNESNCEGCDYRFEKEDSFMSVKDFVTKMYSPERYSFYLNDNLVDLDTLYDMDAFLNGFEFEDGNTVRLYVQ